MNEHANHVAFQLEATELARRILGERIMCDARIVDTEHNRILRCRSSHYEEYLENDKVVHIDDIYGEWTE